MKNFIIKHKIITSIIAILVLFITLNIFWFFYTGNKYGELTQGMIEDDARLSYHILESDQYVYNVKYPDYLSFTGNVAVGSPDNKAALIIWPGFFNQNKYGIQLIDDSGITNDIMVNKDMRALNPEYQEILNKQEQKVALVFDKAKNKWPILTK